MKVLSLSAGMAELSTILAIDLSEWDTHGRVDLQIDAYPRVILRRGAAGRTEFELRLGRLPSAYQECEALLDQVMLRVTARAAKLRAAPVLAADGEHLLLQMALREERASSLKEALECFLNEADYWQAVLRERV